MAKRRTKQQKIKAKHQMPTSSVVVENSVNRTQIETLPPSTEPADKKVSRQLMMSQPHQVWGDLQKTLIVTLIVSLVLIGWYLWLK